MFQIRKPADPAVLEDRYRRLARIIETSPGALGRGRLGQDEHRWLGQATAFIDEVGEAHDAAAARIHGSNIAGNINRESACGQLEVILFRIMAVLERESPMPFGGVFIPTGGAFTAYDATSKILGRAKRNSLIVDPYFNADAFGELFPRVPEGLTGRLLLDARSQKLNEVLKVAYSKWRTQYGDDRPINVRVAPPGSLHDRLIILDSAEVYLVSQSFKDIATRSPASIMLADKDLSALKASAYEALWESATPMQ